MLPARPASAQGQEMTMAENASQFLQHTDGSGGNNPAFNHRSSRASSISSVPRIQNQVMYVCHGHCSGPECEFTQSIRHWQSMVMLGDDCAYQAEGFERKPILGSGNQLAAVGRLDKDRESLARMREVLQGKLESKHRNRERKRMRSLTSSPSTQMVAIGSSIGTLSQKLEMKIESKKSKRAAAAAKQTAAASGSKGLQQQQQGSKSKESSKRSNSSASSTNNSNNPRAKESESTTSDNIHSRKENKEEKEDSFTGGQLDKYSEWAFKRRLAVIMFRVYFFFFRYWRSFPESTPAASTTTSNFERREEG